MTPDPDPTHNEHNLALGEALASFVRDVMRASVQKDDPLRRSVTERFRQAVELAASHGIEVALAWHSLGVWTEEGKERVGYFARALDCQAAFVIVHPSRTALEQWADVHMQADCLFEIGRIHAHEGEPAVARDFFERALPLARTCETLRPQCEPPLTHDDRLEGRILELLLQLPEEGEGPLLP